jgi:hypothetical protein
VKTIKFTLINCGKPPPVNPSGQSAVGAGPGSVAPNANASGGAPPATGNVSATTSFGVDLPRGRAAGGTIPGSGDLSRGETTTTNPGGAAVGSSSPPITGQSSPVAPVAVQGIAAQTLVTPQTGLAKVAEDGVSTKIVRAKPCSAAARETDGTTTCVGIPSRDKR